MQTEIIVLVMTLVRIRMSSYERRCVCVCVCVRMCVCEEEEERGKQPIHTRPMVISAVVYRYMNWRCQSGSSLPASILRDYSVASKERGAADANGCAGSSQAEQ